MSNIHSVEKHFSGKEHMLEIQFWKHQIWRWIAKSGAGLQFMLLVTVRSHDESAQW